MNRSLALLLGLFAVACGSISKDYPQKTFYAFEVERAERVEPAPDAPLLIVQRFKSSALSKGLGLIYRTQPSTYEADYYSEFFNEPEDLLTWVVGSWMADSGLFSVTIGGSTEIESDYVLHGSLRDLHVDQTIKGETRAVADVQFFLSRRDRASSELIWHADFKCSEIAESPRGADVLEAWNRGLTLILSEAEAELAQALLAGD